MLSIIAGVICVLIPLLILLNDFNKSKTLKEKLDAFLEFTLDPFYGFSALFYLGILLLIFGFLKLQI